MTVFVAVFAALQFASPVKSALNTYALYDNQEMNDVDVVISTGRARVSSTFSYISGFTIFSQVMPLLMLAIGLALPRGRNQTLFLAATVGCFVTLPMAGSRGPLLLLGAGLMLIAWNSGILRTRVGRRLVSAGALGALVTLVFSPDAILGILDRFKSTDGETSSRMFESMLFLPPVTFSTFKFPMMGTGTGMEQNAAYSLGLHKPGYGAEAEYGKILVELGGIGWMLLWFVRIAVVVALFKLGRMFRRHKLGGAQGACIALTMFIMTGKVFHDHVSQALLLTAVGVLLSLAVQMRTQQQPAPTRWPPARRA